MLNQVIQSVKEDFKKVKYVLSFQDFLDIFTENPKSLARTAAEYLHDAILFYGKSPVTLPSGQPQTHFHVFDAAKPSHKPFLVGQEEVHAKIVQILEQFVRQGRVDKLILLHGPNGSCKSSTVETLARALELYSQTPEGAVYRFNWIFPSDKLGREGLAEEEEKGHLGFGNSSKNFKTIGSFAHLEGEEILCKITSEMKENPIFLIPKEERGKVLNHFFESQTFKTIPHFLTEEGLSSKNKKIFDSLLLTYKGDFEKVVRHVQVERFFYSARYRTGLATVEPQFAIDAVDKQLTLERNLQNLPPVLQNIRLFEPQGELIDANRGMIEYSDLLKRPLDAFKYLLTTIEKMSINLTSGMADLDLVMLASSNEKHLDALKSSPDWLSFKGRFELVRVPYVLVPSLEEKIYLLDQSTIEKTKPFAPYALKLLCIWAILTRLREPDITFYREPLRSVVERLTPYSKASLYDGEDLGNDFTESEKNLLKENVGVILKEGQSSLAYEGRFGASPREIKMILYFASQNHRYDMVSSLSIFEELEKLLLDTSVYEYLQFEPHHQYHDCQKFLIYIKLLYKKWFEEEFLKALGLYDERQYVQALQKYLKHVTAFLKKEKIRNEVTGKDEEPSEKLMEELEGLMTQLPQGSVSPSVMRESFMNRLAAWRVENTAQALDLKAVFHHELQAIQSNIYTRQASTIGAIRQGMLTWGSEDYELLGAQIKAKCEDVYTILETQFGYSRQTAWESLIFIKYFDV